MNKTLYNIISNITSRFCTIFLGILLIPVYIKYLGMESYGLVGFYTTLSGALALLDLGLSRTMTRELARLTALDQPAVHVRNLTYSLELIYWLIGIILGIAIILLAPLIARYWVNPEKLSLLQVKNAVMLMGGIMAVQWPISLYTGGLFGLQRQVPYNIAFTLLSILKSVGVIFVLVFISPTVKAFFVWQIGITFLIVMVLRYLLWKYMPVLKGKPQFSIAEVKKIWRYAAGVTAISLATFCLVQIDKIVLSKILSLEYFGYYTFAWTVGSGILVLTGTISTSLFPRLTGIVAKNEHREIVTTYHRYYRFLSSAVIPAGLVLCFFSKQILLLWTHNADLSEKVWLAVVLLTTGSICNSMMHIPYQLMMAHGWTRFTFYQNLIASIILTPLLFWWTRLFGLTGATLVWLSVNAGYVLISIPLIHQRLLKGELKRVYFQDIGVPFLISFTILGISRLLLQATNPRFELYIVAIFLALTLVYALLIFSNKEYKLFVKKIIVSLLLFKLKYSAEYRHMLKKK